MRDTFPVIDSNVNDRMPWYAPVVCALLFGAILFAGVLSGAHLERNSIRQQIKTALDNCDSGTTIKVLGIRIQPDSKCKASWPVHYISRPEKWQIAGAGDNTPINKEGN